MTKNDVGPRTENHTRALPERNQQIHRQQCHAHQALSAHAGEANPFHIEAVLRHQLRFHAIFRAEPNHMPAARRMCSRHSQCRKHVTAGAAGHDQDRPRGRRLRHCVLSSAVATPNRCAAAARARSSWRRPRCRRSSRSGSVKPFVGNIPMFTPMLMIACTAEPQIRCPARPMRENSARALPLAIRLRTRATRARRTSR